MTDDLFQDVFDGNNANVLLVAVDHYEQLVLGCQKGVEDLVQRLGFVNVEDRWFHDVADQATLAAGHQITQIERADDGLTIAQ